MEKIHQTQLPKGIKLGLLLPLFALTLAEGAVVEQGMNSDTALSESKVMYSGSKTLPDFVHRLMDYWSRQLSPDRQPAIQQDLAEVAKFQNIDYVRENRGLNPYQTEINDLKGRLTQNWKYLSPQQQDDLFNECISSANPDLQTLILAVVPKRSTWSLSSWSTSNKQKFNKQKLDSAVAVLDRLIDEAVTGLQTVTPGEYKAALDTLKSNWSILPETEKVRISKLSGSIFPKVAKFGSDVKPPATPAISLEERGEQMVANWKSGILKRDLQTILKDTDVTEEKPTSAERTIGYCWDSVPEPEVQLLARKGYIYDAEAKKLNKIQQSDEANPLEPA